MTFVYFLGILSIFLPIGLGVSFLTQLFSQYHDTIFLIGGIFLIFLGMTLLLGQQMSLPFSVHPKLKGQDFVSVYVLGGVYTLAYVLGMVLPLFIIAFTLDKVDFTQKFVAFRKRISYSVLGQKVSLTFANLFSGLMFLVLGIVIIYLAKTSQLTSHSSYQVSLNIYLTKFINGIGRFTQVIPEAGWAAIFILVTLFVTFTAIRQFINLKKRK